jgi:hypothetical protein
MSGVRSLRLVENPLAFEFSKTRAICDAFDEAWAFLQGLGSNLTEPSNSLATQTILAKRIIEMADQGARDVAELRNDALAFLERSPPSASRNGLGEAIGAQTAPVAELSRAGNVGETPQLEHVPPQLNQGDSRGAEDGRGYRH